MSGHIKVGNYHKAGFWYLACKKGYIGFCQDVQLINKDLVSQEDLSVACVHTLTELHAVWVKGPGATFSKAQQDTKLLMAKLQTTGDRADKYWQNFAEKHGQPELLESGADLAGLDMSYLVNSNDTEYPELDDERYDSQEELEKIFNHTSGESGQIGSEYAKLVREQDTLISLSMTSIEKQGRGD